MQIDSYVSERRKIRKKRQGYLLAVIIFLVIYFVFLGIFLFIVRLPAFQAQKITIEGTSAISQAEIMSLLQASIVRKDAALNEPDSGLKTLLGFKNMLIWPDALPTSTVASIPQLAGVTIAKDYFLHTITVTVTERSPFAVWCLMPKSADENSTSTDANLDGEQCFWFDGQGTAFAKTLDTQGNAIFVVHDYSQSNAVTVGEKILPDEFIPDLISIIKVLMGSGLDIQSIALNDLSLEQVNVAVANGPLLYFSLRFPADDDLAVLKNIMAKPGSNKLQYIDFTVENRAYYK